MKRVVRNICITAAWLYTIAVVLWFILHSWLGDTIWWLALLSSFAPFLFLPLALILPACFAFQRRRLWASIVLPIAIFLLLYGNLFLPPWFSPGQWEMPLTIMTFNIWGYSRSQETAQVVLNKAPDIIALQELGTEMAEMLIEGTRDKYPYHAINIGAREYGVGVLSRYPLTEIDSSHLSDSNWQVQIFQVETEGHKFILYNVHLQVSNILIYLEEKSSIAHKVETSFENRRSQVQRLAADIAARGRPVIVVGDLNSTDQSDVYRILAERLIDTHQAGGWGLGHTFPAYSGSWRGIPIVPRQMRIDMIFCSREFVALSSQVSDAHGESDHLPVIAQIAWRK